MKTIRTLREWSERLNLRERLILQACKHENPEEELSANEVVDMIVEWGGGIFSGYRLRSIVRRVYGIELE